jgi:uncharacterized protein (TIGR03435 family)
MRLFLLSILVSASVVFAQIEKMPSFEVVAIKPLPAPTPQNPREAASQFAFKVDGAQVEIRGYPPLSIISRAFRVPVQRVVAPDFARSQYFEIRATLPEGAKPDQVPEMLQSMLAERFKLAHHREMRDYMLDVLSVGKGGMKLTPLPDGTPESQKTTPLGDGGIHIVHVGTISSLVPVMNSFGGLKLLDETGLPGIYSWVRDQQRAEPPMTYTDAVQNSFRDMITSAGLKLERRKVAQETIVVDHLEKVPTEN